MSIMRSNLLGCLPVVALCGAAHAATIVPVAPVPNSIATNAFGINDANTIAGAYTDTSGIEHAFFGTPDGKYTTFDSGSGGTEARAINNNGFITGFSNSSAHDTSQQAIFERLANGKILPVTYHGQQVFGQAQGLGNDNRFAGTYWDFVNSESDAFVGRKGRFLHTIFFSARRQGSTGEAINSNGTVVGWLRGPPGHGLTQHGTITTV